MIERLWDRMLALMDGRGHDIFSQGFVVKNELLFEKSQNKVKRGRRV